MRKMSGRNRHGRRAGSTGLALLVPLLFAGVPAPSAADPERGADLSQAISITGQIMDRQGRTYILQHAANHIRIDLSGWPARGSGAVPSLLGNTVTATGPFDEALRETGDLVANSHYDRDGNTVRILLPARLRALDEPYKLPIAGDGRDAARVAGEVTRIDGRTIELRVGPSTIHVDTGGMTSNPLDGVGDYRVEIGDVLQVGGTLSAEFVETHTIDARQLTTIDVIHAESRTHARRQPT